MILFNIRRLPIPVASGVEVTKAPFANDTDIFQARFTVTCGLYY